MMLTILNGFVSAQWLPLLSDVLWRGTALLFVGFALTLLARRQPALRHRLGACTLGGLLLLPLLSGVPRLITVVPLLLPNPLAKQFEVEPHEAGVATRIWAQPLPARSQPLPVRVPVSSPREEQVFTPPAHVPSVDGTPMRDLARSTGQLPPAASLSWRESAIRLAFSIWLLGACFVLARALHSYALLRRLPIVTSYTPDMDPLREQCAQLAAALKLRHPVALRVAQGDSVAVPMTWGWRRPIVLLPGAARTWPDAERRSALLHELSHVQRGDWAVQCLATLVCALYWFHPLVWLTAAQLRADAERATDEQVVASGVKASDYCTHLLTMAHNAARVHTPAYARCAVPMARETRLERRLSPLLGAASTRLGWRIPTFVVVGIFGLAFATLTTLQFVARAVPSRDTVARVVATPQASPSGNLPVAAELKRRAQEQQRLERQLREAINVSRSREQGSGINGLRRQLEEPPLPFHKQENARAQVQELQRRIATLQTQIVTLRAQQGLDGSKSSHIVATSYTASVPGGGQVSLLGVSDAASHNRTWWTPNGQWLPDKSFVIGFSKKPRAGDKTRQFVAELRLPKDKGIAWSWQIQPSRGYMTGPTVYGNKPLSDTYRTFLLGLSAPMPQGQSQATLDLRLSLKPWRTLVETPRGTALSRLVQGYWVSIPSYAKPALGDSPLVTQGGTMRIEGKAVAGGKAQEGISFPTKDRSTTVLTISHTISDQDVRLVAVDTRGREHSSFWSYTMLGDGTGNTQPLRSKRDGSSNTQSRRLMVLFKDLPLSQIRAFRVQVQPVCTITFPNVRLSPQSGVASQPTIAAHELRDGISEAGVTKPQSLATTAGPASKARIKSSNITAPAYSYTAKLPTSAGGSIVSLLGVSDAASPNKAWWTPQGQRLPNTKFELPLRSLSKAGYKARQFVVGLKGLPNAHMWWWDLQPTRGTTGGRALSGGVSVGGKGTSGTYLQGLSFLVPPQQSRVDLTLHVVLQPWRTLVESQKGVPLTRSIEGYSVVASAGDEFDQSQNIVISGGPITVTGSSKPFTAGQRSARVTISHTISDQEVRVVAVDVQGREHPPRLSYLSAKHFPPGSKKFLNLTSDFDLPLSRVRAFRLQVQPICTVTFPNVWLDAPAG